MRAVGISEDDIAGILFTEFPDDMSMAESRDMLEMTVAEVYEEDYKDFDEDIRPEMVLSPFWIARALMRMSTKEYERMPEPERRAALKEAFENRPGASRGVDKPVSEVVR